MDKKPNNIDTPTLNYKTDYRNIKYPRLEFKTGTLLLVLPKNYENEKDILTKHKTWINKKQQIIQNALKKSKTKNLNLTRTNQQLKHLVHTIIEKNQKQLHIKINKIYFRKMKTKWGSYSTKGNLTINTLLKHLPNKLIEYVILHEMTHSQERKHNKRFWKIISKKIKEHQKREKDLLVYWFLVQTLTQSNQQILL
jgi:predicted metal-dependent hydrolase